MLDIDVLILYRVPRAHKKKGEGKERVTSIYLRTSRISRNVGVAAGCISFARAHTFAPSQLAGTTVRVCKGQVILQRAAENPQGRGGFLETLLPDVGIEEVQLGTYEVKRWMIVA